MIEALGASVIRWSGGVINFLISSLETSVSLVRQCATLRLRYREVVDQMYAIGVQSLPVVAFSLTFISLMLILEFSFHMKLVLRQDSLVPAFSTVLMLRELGPVITALLLASRVGSSIAAEVGTMVTTEQIDALRLVGVDPVEFLTVPRWIATVFAAISLSILAIGIAIVGGASMASISLGHTRGEYFNTMFTFVRFQDLVSCVIKSTVFGSIIPLIASFEGFRCQKGSRGVGNAATNTVVRSSILIICLDFVLTYTLYAL